MPHSKIAEARWNSVQARLKAMSEKIESQDKQIKKLFSLVKKEETTTEKDLRIYELSLNATPEVTKYISWLLVAQKLTATDASKLMDYVINFVDGHRDCI